MSLEEGEGVGGVVGAVAGDGSVLVDGVVIGADGSDFTDGSGCGVLGGLLQAARENAMPRPVSNWA
jgi:hypothetical protein